MTAELQKLEELIKEANTIAEALYKKSSEEYRYLESNASSKKERQKAWDKNYNLGGALTAIEEVQRYINITKKIIK